jgi:hypothetical protein
MMFTTFSTSGRGRSSAVTETAAIASSSNTRPKRTQVARACLSCRGYRIKCDDKVPCANCKTRGVRCSNDSNDSNDSNASNNDSNLSNPSNVSNSSSNASSASPKPLSSSSSSTSYQTVAPNSAPDEGQLPTGTPVPEAPNGHYQQESNRKRRRQPSPVTETAGLGPRAMSHAPTFSPSHHADRMASYLSKALGRPVLPSELRPKPAANTGLPRTISTPLSRTHEVFFLNLYWQSYQCLFPILDEDDFMQHYDSLWSASASDSNSELPRSQSPLVDIVLALCMQYGTAFHVSLSHTESLTEPDADASVAGSDFFARCRNRLDLEAPTLATVQSQILSALWLANASLIHTALTTLASAVRLAHILQLHHNPPEHLPQRERSLRRRTWWTLFALERQLSMESGQSSLIQLSICSCEAPWTGAFGEILSGTQLSSEHDDISWLSFHQHWVKLVTASSAIQSSFLEKQAHLLGTSLQTMHEDLEVLESLALWLSANLKPIYTWREELPDTLKGGWQGDVDPFSTHRTRIQVNASGPLWLQRQRVLLVLRHHHTMMTLLRPFYRFPPGSTSTTPLSDSHCISCIYHAITITNILHSVSTETDILSGWYEACKIQWDATLCILGFMLSNPVCPPTPLARKTIPSAISVFSVFGANYVFAVNASKIAQSLYDVALRLMDEFWTSVNGRPIPDLSPTSSSTQSIPFFLEPPLMETSGIDFTSQYAMLPDMDDGNSLLQLTPFSFMSTDKMWMQDSASWGEQRTMMQ